MEFFNLKQPHGANKYPQYTAVYSKYTAVYSRVYGRILRYWSLEYTAVYPKSPKWGSFKHNIDHHNWQTRGIPQPTYACIVHYTFVPTCTCHIPLSPKTPFFTRILPGIPGMPGYAHRNPTTPKFLPKVFVARWQLWRNAPLKGHHSRYITLFFEGTYSVIGFYELTRVFLVSFMHFLR